MTDPHSGSFHRLPQRFGGAPTGVDAGAGSLPAAHGGPPPAHDTVPVHAAAPGPATAAAPTPRAAAPATVAPGPHPPQTSLPAGAAPMPGFAAPTPSHRATAPRDAVAPTPGRPRAKRRRGRRVLVAVLTPLLLLGIGVGAAEWRVRADAVAMYAEILESQQFVLSRSDGEIVASGAFTGGAALLEQSGERWSRIELDAVTSSGTVGEFTLRYELIGAPISGTGTIDRVVISTSLSEERVGELLYNSDYDDYVAEHEFVQGLVRTTEPTPQGGIWVKEDRHSAVDGDRVLEHVRREYNGVDRLGDLPERELRGDACGRRSLDSTLEQMEIIDDERLVMRWYIDDLDVDDLTHAICFGYG